MSQELVLKFAQQGNPSAIATLMNIALQSKGVTASVQQDGDRLLTCLESVQQLNRAAALAFVCSGLASLGLTSIRQLEIYGYQSGQELPIWQHVIDLALYPLVPVGEPEILELQPDLVEELVQVEIPEIPRQPLQIGQRTLKAAPLVMLPAAIAGLYFTHAKFSSQIGTSSISPLFQPTTTATAADFPDFSVKVTLPKPVSRPETFRHAVNKAIGAVNLGQDAQSGADWQLVAYQWHQAAELMRAVPIASMRWELAQQKVVEYQRNRDYTRQLASHRGAVAKSAPAKTVETLPPRQQFPAQISQTVFEKIQFGDSYRKVAAMLGSAGKGVSWYTNAVYRWESLNGSVLEAKFQDDKLIGQPTAWAISHVPEEYRKVASGMSINKAQEILGTPKTTNHSISLMYRWEREDGSMVEATFVDDRLVYKSWSD